MRTRILVTLAALAAGAALIPAPAAAAARVSISNDRGSATVDPTYATTIRVKGSGFQSVEGGHGGIYVFFGTKVPGGHLYVPDSETKGNQGFQRFVAFPGSDTAESANGGTIKADGTWSTSMVVPGATFKAVNRSGQAQTVDCRTTTCGIITLGAHGVKNARNETFTPVSFQDLHAGQAPKPSPTVTPKAATAPGTPTGAPVPEKVQKVAAAITVDRRTAVQGRVLAFTAVGFAPGEQVLAVLDDGAAAAGPIVAGTGGHVAGVIQVPATASAGTHTLRLSAAGSGTEVEQNFPIAADPATAAASAPDDRDWLPWAAAGAAAVLLGLSLAFAVVRTRRLRATGGAGHAI